MSDTSASVSDPSQCVKQVAPLPEEGERRQLMTPGEAVTLLSLKSASVYIAIAVQELHLPPSYFLKWQHPPAEEMGWLNETTISFHAPLQNQQNWCKGYKHLTTKDQATAQTTELQEGNEALCINSTHYYQTLQTQTVKRCLRHLHIAWDAAAKGAATAHCRRSSLGSAHSATRTQNLRYWTP